MKAAEKRARRIVHKYRQGNGWVVCTWNERMGCWLTGDEVTYSAACQQVRDEVRILIEKEKELEAQR